MATHDFKFYFADSYCGALNPEDVHLFYYDICYDKEQNFYKQYEWTDEIDAYLHDNNTVIEVVNKSDMPTTVGNNQMFMIEATDDEGNKAATFFRHLRNISSHYEIGDNNAYYCMKDHHWNGSKRGDMTMIGKIDKTIFKGLMEFFFKQKAEIEKKMGQDYDKEI